MQSERFRCCTAHSAHRLRARDTCKVGCRRKVAVQNCPFSLSLGQMMSRRKFVASPPEITPQTKQHVMRDLRQELPYIGWAKNSVFREGVAVYRCPNILSRTDGNCSQFCSVPFFRRADFWHHHRFPLSPSLRAAS